MIDLTLIVMDEEGNVVPGATKPSVDDETALRMYENMIRLHVRIRNPITSLLVSYSPVLLVNG